jgi:colanic acid biosynthesis glycosyl transferase WcaI
LLKPQYKHWLILTQYFPPEMGAPQIRLRSLVRRLKSHGIQVEVLTAMPNYPTGKTFPEYAGCWYMKDEVDQVPVRRTWIYAGTGKSALVRLANYLSFTATAFIAALSGPRPDVLFVESQPISLGIIGVLMKYLRGVPYVYNVPDLQVEAAEQMGFLRNKLLLRLAMAMETFFLRKAWTVSTVTERFIEYFQRRGVPPKQISFLPNGADTEFLKPRTPDTELLRRWNLEGKKVFAYVGTHAYYHGLDVLIEAAAQLQEESEIAFLMIGNGPERARIQKLAADKGLKNVIFGQSSYEEMDRLYSICYASIAVLRDMEVAHSMRLSKIFPALSCGVPVIYAGMGEAAELIKNAGCGITVAPERPALLADAIRALASSPKMREEMGRTGRLLVTRDYSWSKIVDRWLQEIGVSQDQVETEVTSSV